MLPDTMRVTVLPRGRVALTDGDALRRLHELGFIPKRPPKDYSVVGFGPGYQDAALKLLPAIRDLRHFREVVGNPRSPGLLSRTLDPGMTVIMERTNHPFRKDIPWYVLLDTSLGSAAGFFELLQEYGHITIEAADCQFVDKI